MRLVACAAVFVILLAAGGCRRAEPARASTSAPASSASSASSTSSTSSPGAASSAPHGLAPAADAPTRDLSIDEAMGGHTLSRHVGRTDAQLAERLRREPDISAASTYSDRAAAERAVGAAIASGGGSLRAWQHRSGRRPNFVLHYTDRSGKPLGRSLSRGESAPQSCERAIVVLRWNERRNIFYVLTSYPEAQR